MSANKVKTPYIKFSDIDGNPLEDGYIYIGAINQNPEVVPVNVYWDAAMTIPAAQPIRTIGGFPSRSGTAATIFTAADYSITIKNKNGTLIHTIPMSSGLINSVNVNSIAELTGLEDYGTVNARGYAIAGDGGGGIFNYDATKSAVNNGGTIINGWVRQYSGAISAEWFGAVGDGITNNYDAFRAIASALVDNDKVVFNGNYLISYAGGYDALNIHGTVAFPIKDVKNIEIDGQKSTITIVDHNITLNSGLLVFSHDGVQNLNIHGFKFNLSFTGRNDSATYYPYCGAIHGFDTSGTAGARTGAQLSSTIKVYDNVFNLYHPLGCFAEALNSFPGDPNNGFKIYSYTAFGDTAATARVNQNYDVSFHNNTFLSTHNAYGFWAWSYNSVQAKNNIGESWANYATNSSGVSNGSSIPMIRYHQFYCSGIDVSHNQMNARNLTDRTAGYQGKATLAHITTNLAIDLTHGESIASMNQMTLRTNDTGILFGVYGTVECFGNIINGIDKTDRPVVGIDILTNEKGIGNYNISSNVTNKLFSAPLIRIDNSAALAADRRVKNLTISKNVCLNNYGLGVVFLNNSVKATSGVENVFINDNIFDSRDSEYSILNSNGAAFDGTLCTTATDLWSIRNNSVSYFYNLEKTANVTVTSEGNRGSNITSATNYNYLPINKQVRSTFIVAAGVIPRVGVNGLDIFSYSAKRTDLVSGVVLQVSGGTVAGGSSIATATPAGQQWEIDQTLVGNKGVQGT